MLSQDLLLEKLSEENIEKINQLEKIGIEVEYDPEGDAFKIYTDDTKVEFFALAENRLLQGLSSKYPFGLVPFYNSKRENPYKVLSDFKRVTISPKNIFRNDQEALENLPKPETLTGGLEYLFENRNRAEILRVLVPGSTIANKVLTIFDAFIDYDYLELPTVIEYDMKKDILPGQLAVTYTPYATVSLLSKNYFGRKVRYSLYPYALSKEEIGKGKIEIISKDPNEKLDIHDESLDPGMKQLIRMLEKVEESNE